MKIVEIHPVENSDEMSVTLQYGPVFRLILKPHAKTDANGTYLPENGEVKRSLDLWLHNQNGKPLSEWKVGDSLQIMNGESLEVIKSFGE